MTLDKLPPGKYIVDEATGMVLHGDTGEPVSLTEEQQKIVVEQVLRARLKETQDLYDRIGRLYR